MLSKVKVFVPVSVDDELPEETNTRHGVIIKGSDCVDTAVFDINKSWIGMGTAKVDKWLQGKELYCFTKEELEKLVTNVYDECWSNTAEGWNGEIQPHRFMNGKEKEVYEHRKAKCINQLIK